jgi:hypothetical protein
VICLALLLDACSAEPPAPAVPAAPPDEWASLPKSAQWLHAVAGFSGNRKQECAEVQKWIEGEAKCAATACENARDLSRDWLSRCEKLAPDGVAKVKELLPSFEERSKQSDSACMVELKPLLEGKCGADKTCEEPAQKWATRCSATEGSPLGVQILVRFVQRRVNDHDVELDLRPCSDLHAGVIGAVACENKFTCEEGIAKIDVYRARCEEEGQKPPVSFALAQMVILAAAERKVEPILASPDDDASAALRTKLPLLLADGSGVVVSVCGARPTTPDAYKTAMLECGDDGTIVYARAFKLPGAFEVRMGQVAVADTATFIKRYPALLLPGERERYDKESAAAFLNQLDAAAKLASDPKTAAEGGKKLLALLRERGREIWRSDPMRAAIKAKDASFTLAFKDLGKLKNATKATKKELGLLAQRAQQYAFADVESDGTVSLGATSWAALFDTSALLPESHAAYLKELKPLLKRAAKDMPNEEVDADEARAFGTLADECQTNAVAAKNAERALLDCAFGLRTCDAAQVEAMAKTLDTTRATSETAFLVASSFTTAAVGKSIEFYKKIMATGQCEPPTW